MINFRLVLKGVAMGAADLIPGVSGGTIALITGIYEQLINSIKSFDLVALKLILRGRFKELWIRVNGSFLVQVFSGVLISLFSLARLLSYLLAEFPISVWSFFFGLILVSAFYVMPANRTFKVYIFAIIGVAVAYLITSLSPSETPNQYWFIFLSGAIAICAMILPGISGSFILILLGKYEFILSAIDFKALNIPVIIVFGFGCVIGLISFSKLIHWLLEHHKGVTLATLAGFMIGSLNKVWPWKMMEGSNFYNVFPHQYAEMTDQPSYFFVAILCLIAGGGIVIILERFGQSKQ